MAVAVDIKALLEAGVHFGHKTSRWHPKMAPYIHSKRQDSHIIDLTKTVEGLEKALPVITKTAASGKQILFVGTKKQTKDIVKAAAEKAGQAYVTERWIGGMLTNVATTTAQIKKLKDLEKRMASGDLEKRYNKLEVQRFQEEIDLLNSKYDGIKDLNGRPGLIIVVDTLADKNASPAQIEKALDREGDAILTSLRKGAYLAALCVEGRPVSSEELAALLAERAGSGDADIAFVLGSSHGLADKVKKAADVRLSLGRITLPHQLARLVMAEQLYRACTINAGLKYHK